MSGESAPGSEPAGGCVDVSPCRFAICLACEAVEQKHQASAEGTRSIVRCKGRSVTIFRRKVRSRQRPGQQAGKGSDAKRRNEPGETGRPAQQVTRRGRLTSVRYADHAERALYHQSATGLWCRVNDSVSLALMPFGYLGARPCRGTDVSSYMPGLAAFCTS